MARSRCGNWWDKETSETPLPLYNSQPSGPRLTSPKPTSLLKWIRTVIVRASRPLQETALDQRPNPPDARNKANQHPPTRLISIVPALDLYDNPHQEQRKHQQSCDCLQCLR